MGELKSTILVAALGDRAVDDEWDGADGVRDAGAAMGEQASRTGEAVFRCRCGRCGGVLEVPEPARGGTQACAGCGAEVRIPGELPIALPEGDATEEPVPLAYAGATPSPARPKAPGSVASLVCGCLGMLLGPLGLLLRSLPLPLGGGICGLLAIGASVEAFLYLPSHRNHGGRGLAVAGLVLGLAGVAWETLAVMGRLY